MARPTDGYPVTPEERERLRKDAEEFRSRFTPGMKKTLEKASRRSRRRRRRCWWCGR